MARPTAEATLEHMSMAKAPPAPSPLPDTKGIEADRFMWSDEKDVIPLDLEERLPPVEKDVDA